VAEEDVRGEQVRTLIGVISYEGDAWNGNHDAIRQTWGPKVAEAGMDLRFFIGRRNPKYAAQPDEVLIDWQKSRPCAHPWWSSEKGCCEDFWQVLTKNMLRWSLEQGYDFTFQCENDTFLVPALLAATDYAKYDFSGYMIQGGEAYPWPEPGGGYFLSARAARALINMKPDDLSIGVYAGQALGPLVDDGLLTRKNLDNFWRHASWHYRVETGDGYPAKSNWQMTMHNQYGRR
jgi:hypothetical protein